MKIAITGASGFIGSVLIDELKLQDINYIAVSSDLLNDNERLKNELVGVDVVVHLAGLAHRLGKAVPSAEEFEKANVKLTQWLVDAANISSVKRFIFISSISVYGLNGSKEPIHVETPLNPTDDYGRSKLAAEKIVLDES